MTRFEKLKQMSVEEMAAEICDAFDEAVGEKIDCCSFCPGSPFCHRGHKGLIDYLNEEVSEE